MSQVSILWDDSRIVFSNSSWSNLSSSSELVLRDRLRGMVTQFRKEMSESKSQGMHEEVRLYDDVGSYRGTSLELLISNR